MATNPSQIAATALSGFTDAKSYDAHRPSYPASAVSNLLKQIKVEGINGARILDLAAGTGKLTDLLAQRPEDFDILAVEPHSEMRAQLQKKVAERGWKTVRVEEGFADSMSSVPDGWADAVMVAQAFHWFANMEALREIHRTMAPGAILGLIWNVDDFNSPNDWDPVTDYETKMKDINWSKEDSEKRFRHNEWSKVFDEQLKSSPLSIHSADPLFSLPLGSYSTSWEVWLSKENVWKRMYTHSNLANLQGEELEATKKGILDALDKAPTNERGEVAIHGRTCTWWTTAVPADTLRSGG